MARGRPRNDGLPPKPNIPPEVRDVMKKIPRQKFKRTGQPKLFKKGNEFGKEHRIKKGEVRNPTGGNSSKPFQAACRKIASLKMADDLREAMKLDVGATWLEGLAMGMYRGGIVKGRPGCAVVIRDSLDGAPNQKIELTAPTEAGAIAPTFNITFVQSHLTPDMTEIPPGPKSDGKPILNR